MANDHPQALGSRVVCQIGLVVRDIERSARAYADLFGVEVPDWVLTDTQEKAHIRYRGQPTPGRAKLAFFQLDNISLELIEPVGGPRPGRSSSKPRARASITSPSGSRAWRNRWRSWRGRAWDCCSAGTTRVAATPILTARPSSE